MLTDCEKGFLSVLDAAYLAGLSGGGGVRGDGEERVPTGGQRAQHVIQGHHRGQCQQGCGHRVPRRQLVGRHGLPHLHVCLWLRGPRLVALTFLLRIIRIPEL